MPAKIAMVMAMDKNKLIGKGNGMPWHIPGEMAYFKKITLGKPVIMGRKTHESIGQALPGRQNIVVTRNNEWASAGIDAVTSVEAAIKLARPIRYYGLQRYVADPVKLDQLTLEFSVP